MAAAVLLVGLSGLGLGVRAGSAAAAAPGTVTNYTSPSINAPRRIAAGPDGALWFTNSGSIGRISTAGAVSDYTDESIAHPFSIAAGPDGAMWFTDDGNGSIGRITTAGTVTNYTTGITRANGITAGPDGAMWFTDFGSIGRITTTGTVTHYTGTGIKSPWQIAAGPDGALWFTDINNDSIGRIATTGAVTSYTNPGLNAPDVITAGPDGAMWFTETHDNSSIGRISTTGTVTMYTEPSLYILSSIAAGPDGALWFTNNGDPGDGINSLARITTTGTITPNYTGPGIDGPYGIAAGPDGGMWFTNVRNNSIGRLEPGEPTPECPSLVANLHTSLTLSDGNAVGSVATFVADHDYVLVGTATLTCEPSLSWSGSPPSALFAGMPVVFPGFASVVEGSSETVDLLVPVSLSQATTNTVTVPWTTKFTAGAPVGYADPASDFSAASGTVTFLPGETAKTVTITVNGDGLVEPDEWLLVSFNHPTNGKIGGYYGLGFGKITNDDHATVVPGGATVVEGSTGTVDLEVPVTLSNPSTSTVTVQWSTVPLPDVPPRADSATDFTLASGTVTFLPGETAKTVTISVNGDVDLEPNEWIVVSFNHPTNAKMGGFWGLGFGVIINDD